MPPPNPGFVGVSALDADIPPILGIFWLARRARKRLLRGEFGGVRHPRWRGIAGWKLRRIFRLTFWYGAL